MVRLQLSERSMFRYPPYYRLIVLVLRSRNESVLQELSVIYAEKLHARLGERVLGPVTPPVTRVQTLHIKKIVLKIEIAAAIAPCQGNTGGCPFRDATLFAIQAIAGAL